MCVVGQTVERIARELRESASKLERASRLMQASPGTMQNSLAKDAATVMEVEAVSLRSRAKLLDGKE